MRALPLMQSLNAISRSGSAGIDLPGVPSGAAEDEPRHLDGALIELIAPRHRRNVVHMTWLRQTPSHKVKEGRPLKQQGQG